MKILEYGILALGIAIGGWFIGDGIVTFRKLDQVVEVRGLDERLVTANEGSLDLRFIVSAETIKELSERLDNTQKAMEEVLAAEGFSGGAVQRVAVTIMDNAQVRPYNEVNKMTRFSARAGVQIFSTDVEKIQALSQKTDKLIARGVPVESAFPKFSFTDLNKLKPTMLVAATKGAREAAESFARDSGATLGSIKTASQGLFSITAPGVDYDEASSIQKRVRVVTRVTYYMK